MQCACAIFSSMACPVLQYVSTLSHKRHDFLKIGIEYKMRVSLFSTNLCQTVFIIRRIDRDMITNVYWAL
jgi:hypothetical protein